VYARDVNGRTLTFGVSGKLIRNSLVIFDRETGTLWSHLTGEALEGPLVGQHLQQVLSEQTTWGRWRAEHPRTLMLAVDRGTASFDPYEGYYAAPDAGVVGRKRADDRLPVKEKVIGVRLGGEAKAYSFRALARDRVVNDTVGGVPLVVVFDPTSYSGAVYRRDPAGTVLSFTPGSTSFSLRDDRTGSQWDGLSGKALSGIEAGMELEQVPITYSFWFGWADFYPNTEVYRQLRLGCHTPVTFASYPRVDLDLAEVIR
jgi:uncharacterized protein DUF3179